MTAQVVEPVLPGIDWPEPVLTADLIIARELTSAIEQHERFSAAMRVHMDFPVDDKSAEAELARWKMLAFLQGFIQSAGFADLLVTIQGMAPGLADEIAREWDWRGESGEQMEWVWGWAHQRGLDPEKIVEHTQEELNK